MFPISFDSVVLLFYLSSSVFALPIRREVPQEQSHEPFLTSVRASLDTNNPAGIVDPVFGLLGDAAAAGGAGKITDVTCLQQATADQAFTNAKAAGDVQGQVDALIYRALERNSGQVGLATAACTSIQAVNPEIAAIQQHQDPASTNAAALNKAIVLALAKQINAVGGNPQDALKSGTFAPGNLNDDTGKGNTCDDANDPNGCIFTQNLLVPDATAAEIDAAVSGAGEIANTSGAPALAAAPVSTSATSTSAEGVATSSATQQTTGTTTNVAAASPSAASENLQTFVGALGGATAPAVTVGGRGFEVAGESDSFLNLAAAAQRSCSIQHNQCADIANSATGRATGLTVGQCDQQNTQCNTGAGAAQATATQALVTAASSATNVAIASASAPAVGGNLQTFTGALGGATAPAVTTGGRGFEVAGESDSFLNQAAAIQRSCSIQHNQCADIANSATGRATGLSVGQCDQQNTQCTAVA